MNLSDRKVSNDKDTMHDDMHFFISLTLIDSFYNASIHK